jgi:hypothetical protein
MTVPSASQLFLQSAMLEDSSVQNPYFDYFTQSSGKGIEQNFQNRIGSIYSQNPYYQKGYGYLGGHRAKYGRGIGSALSSLWRMAFPMIKKGAQALGTAAADVASNIATDVLQGKNFKESAIEHAKKKGIELLKEVPGTLNKTTPSIENNITQAQDLAVSAPPQFRRVNRKRHPESPKKISAPKRKKYPALKHLK